jgi:hypothetical protein
MKIKIGEASSKGVGFDLDTLLVTRLLIQANSGAGKSWLLRKLIEQLYGHVQVIVIDPEGEFATLRKKYDFVLVGAGGETPADVRSAGLLAEKLLELRASAVCDLYEMRPHDRHRWVKAFIEAMVNAPKKLWHPCIVVVDEAQLFCPQDGESEAEEAMVSLTTRGRKRGFCAVWATQRLAKVNKDATSMLLNRLVGGTFEDVDIKRALDLLSVPSEDKFAVSQQLKTIDPGWFFAFGRAISKERLLFKVGQVETPHPQAGSAKHAAEPPPAPEKIRGLLPQLADLPQAAEEKARTIAELQRELRTTRAQLVAKEREKPMTPAAVVSERAIDAAVRKSSAAFERTVKKLRQALEEAMKIIVAVTATGFEGTAVNSGDVKAVMEKAAEQIARIAESRINARNAEFERLKKEADRLAKRLKAILENEEEIKVELDVKRNEPFTIRPPQLSPRAAVSKAISTESNNGEVNLSRPQLALVRALAEAEAVGRSPIGRSWLAFLAGVSPLSSGFEKNVSTLRTTGYVDYGGAGTVQLTEQGRAIAPAIDSPVTTDELLERVCRLLSNPQAVLLRILHNHFPGSFSREKLAELAQVSPLSSGYEKNVSTLSSRELVTYPDRGLVRAADWLFLEAR